MRVTETLSLHPEFNDTAYAIASRSQSKIATIDVPSGKVIL
ncbi:hypothetical protein [Rhodococcus sp. ARC_M6]|nr:hypothetical protein [Rhodococcus sp. ARC_M6]